MTSYTTKPNKHFMGSNTYVFEITNDNKEVLGTVTVKNASDDIVAVKNTTSNFIYSHFFDGTSKELYTRLIN